MAMNKIVVDDPPWAFPVWPDRLPDPEAMKVVYGTIADELVVRFERGRRYDTVVVPITTPDEDYAGVLTDFSSGAVVGIHVYPLLAFAAQVHPLWKPLAEQDPPPEAIARIITDVKDLFNRYGVDDPATT